MKLEKFVRSVCTDIRGTNGDVDVEFDLGVNFSSDGDVIVIGGSLGENRKVASRIKFKVKTFSLKTTEEK